MVDTHRSLGTEDIGEDLELIKDIEEAEYVEELTKQRVLTEESEEEEWVLHEYEYNLEDEGKSIDRLMNRYEEEEEDGGDLVS